MKKWIERFKITKMVKSPCVDDCVISYDDKTCKGCNRFPNEIEEWMTLTEKEKRELLNELRKRKRK